MLNQKRTKIVATMGPATKSKEILKNMILEGVNVFRINFSHADYNVVKENISPLTISRLGFGTFAPISLKRS